MELEGLAPGVQNHQPADLGPQVLARAAATSRSVSRTARQQVVEPFRMCGGDAVELLRHGEHHLIVFDRQQFRLSLLEPLGTLAALARRTVAVASRSCTRGRSCRSGRSGKSVCPSPGYGRPPGRPGPCDGRASGGRRIPSRNAARNRRITSPISSPVPEEGPVWERLVRERLVRERPPGGRVAGAATSPGPATPHAVGRDAHGCRSASSSDRHVPGSSGSSTG